MHTAQRIVLLARLVAVALVVLVSLRVAWVSDDALITLRTALNITHGWGAGYNGTEVVQAYTHPLWFLLWVWVGSWTNQWIIGILILSVVLVGVSVALVLWRTTSLARIALVTAFLLLSNAFIDYTTSGLENPLSYAVIAVAMTLSWSVMNEATIRTSKIFLLGLTGAAAVLTRFDLALLILPAALMLLWRLRGDWRRLLTLVLTVSIPILVWFAWSWLTYSTLLANTFEAKTNVQIPQGELITQGLRYLWVSLEKDPVTLLGLILGLGLGIIVGPGILRAWAFGAIAYVGYTVWVGGDFMAGRFMAVPFLVAMFIVAAAPARLPTGRPVSNPPTSAASVAIGAVVLLLLVAQFVGVPSTSLTDPRTPRWEVDWNLNANVSDERGVYVSNARGLKTYVETLAGPLDTRPFAPLAESTSTNRSLRQIDYNSRNWPIRPQDFMQPSEVGVLCGFLGTVGIATGPTAHLIDECALTDRFLAQRPFKSGGPLTWKMGHFTRAIPEGYVEAISTGDPTRLRDTADAFYLKELWEEIRN